MGSNTKINIVSTKDRLTLTNLIDTPKKLVFRAWTDPELLKKWFSPNNCTTPYCTVNLRIGGNFHFCMRMANGFEIWGLGIYKEIVQDNKLVYLDRFADEDGNIVSPEKYGFNPAHPAETTVSVTFAEKNGKTLLTLKHFVNDDFPERKEMAAGWKEMLESLDELVEKSIVYDI